MPKPIIFELAAIVVAAMSYLYEHAPLPSHALRAVQTQGGVSPAGAAAPVAAAPATQVTAPQMAKTAFAPAPDSDVVQANRKFDQGVVKTAIPDQQAAADTIQVTGKLSLDKRRVRIASARVAGRLGRIFVFEGQSVKAGQPLAEIFSPDYISAEHEFVLAERFRETLSKTATDAELRQDAEATYQAAASRLKVLGASAADIARLAGSGQIEEYLRIRAPISGVVTQRNVDPGGFLNVGDTLMTLANTDVLWLYFNSYDSDYAALRLGEELSFQTSSLPGEHFSGRVAFIAPSVDPATHTLPVRCDIPNAGMRLRPEMFVSGALKTGEKVALLVPKSAVFNVREHDFVFVQKDGWEYRRVPVQGHVVDGDRYAITAGLDQLVPVVIDGALLLNQLVAKAP